MLHKIIKTLTLSTMLCVAGSAYAKSLTFASWGGTTQEQQKIHWAETFTKKTGIKVRQDGPTDYGKIKTMVENKNVVWDVVDAEIDYAMKAQNQGMFEKIDFSIVDKSQLDPRWVTDYFVGSFAYSFVIGYDKSFAHKPVGMKDVFNTEKFPGKRGFYKWASPGLLEASLIADGVDPKNLYPLDLDRAFAKLDTIKKDIIWWSSGAQSQQLLASKEVSIGIFWNGRLTALEQSGVPVGVSWEQNIANADVLVVPKGAKNKENAMKFIAHAVSAKAQANFSVNSGYVPINTHSETYMTDTQKNQLPKNLTDNKVNIDLKYWAENRDAIGKRWYAWQAK